MDKDRLERRMERERDSEFEAMHARKHELERAHDALVEAATLKAVGEALYGQRRIEFFKGATYYVPVFPQEVEALRSGQMPAGWERKG